MKLSILLYTVVLLLGMSCEMPKKSSETTTAKEMLMATTLEAYVDSCWNKGDILNLKGISTENFVRNLNGITVANNQKEMQAHMEVFFKGFPDLAVQMRSCYIKDSIIFTHWTSNGTNTGKFGEIEATGKKVNINGISQLHFNSEGKLVQEDAVFNELQLLQQLGYTLTPPVLE